MVPCHYFTLPIRKYICKDKTNRTDSSAAGIGFKGAVQSIKNLSIYMEYEVISMYSLIVLIGCMLKRKTYFQIPQYMLCKTSYTNANII